VSLPARVRVPFAAAFALALCTVFAPLGAHAARPLPDQHQWDAYFSLFAPDLSLPWKPARVRLDTYSSAPVDFAAYEVDPADVIVAGGNRPARVLDTSRRTALARWRFSPPAGYRFVTNYVDAPLGDREGFFVIEARRGSAAEQVWLNRTRLGVLTKESPEGLLLWAADLGSGRAIRGATVEFLVGLRLLSRTTDENGLISWSQSPRPSFALASFGASRTFVSMLPQAPLPASIVGLRLASSVVRAGGTVRLAGFARKRGPSGVKPLSGDVRIVLSAQGRALASSTEHLDGAGAFSSQLEIPANAAAGDYAILASAGGAVGGTSLTVDAASDARLTIVSSCPCAPAKDVAFTVVAVRGDQPAANLSLAVRVVRTPHVLPPGASDDIPRWGTTAVFDATVRTDGQGRARITLQAPNDGLASTYGVRASSSGASATTRIVVPTASLALAVDPDAAVVDPSGAIGILVRGFDAVDGSPRGGIDVHVLLAHGTSQQDQTVRLDDRGRAHVVFRGASQGTHLAIADASDGGARALDASSVLVAPIALGGSANGDNSVQIGLDKTRYRASDRATVTLAANGLTGDAFVTIEGARVFGWRRFPASGSNASTTVDLNDPQGDVRVAAAAIRDGSIVRGSVPLSIDAPGHERSLSLALDRGSYAPGDTAHVTLRDGDAHGSGTAAIRLADARANGSALFDDAPALLRIGGTASQTPASENPGWHTWVASGSAKSTAFFGDAGVARGDVAPPALGAAAARTLVWRVERSERETFDLALPKEKGRFILSVMKIYDDGDVGAASIGVTVQ
jgi:hypothetical protein